MFSYTRSCVVVFHFRRVFQAFLLAASIVRTPADLVSISRSCSQFSAAAVEARLMDFKIADRRARWRGGQRLIRKPVRGHCCRAAVTFVCLFSIPPRKLSKTGPMTSRRETLRVCICAWSGELTNEAGLFVPKGMSLSMTTHAVWRASGYNCNGLGPYSFFCFPIILSPLLQVVTGIRLSLLTRVNWLTYF